MQISSLNLGTKEDADGFPQFIMAEAMSPGFIFLIANDRQTSTDRNIHKEQELPYRRLLSEVEYKMIKGLPLETEYQMILNCG